MNSRRREPDIYLTPYEQYSLGKIGTAVVYPRWWGRKPVYYRDAVELMDGNGNFAGMVEKMGLKEVDIHVGETRRMFAKCLDGEPYDSIVLLRKREVPVRNVVVGVGEPESVELS
jgi:hypothetical protein